MQFGDLCVGLCFGIIHNLTVELLLGTTIIDKFPMGMFKTEEMNFPGHSHRAAILYKQPIVASIVAVITLIDKYHPNRKEGGEYFPCPKAPQTTI